MVTLVPVSASPPSPEAALAAGPVMTAMVASMVASMVALVVALMVALVMALVVALASQQRPPGHGVGRHEAGPRQHHAEECLGLSSGYHYSFQSKYLNSLEPSCCHENC